MCKLLPSFNGLWRTYNFILAVCCLIISGLLGPVVNLAYHAAGSDGDLATLCKNEPDYCTFLTYIHYLMWIFFFASVLLFFACWYNSICLIHCSMGLIILDIVLSLALFSKYLIYCAIMDNQCLSHKNNDVSIVANLFLMNFLFVLFLGTALFFMGEYKASLVHGYIGFVLFLTGMLRNFVTVLGAWTRPLKPWVLAGCVTRLTKACGSDDDDVTLK